MSCQKRRTLMTDNCFSFQHWFRVKYTTLCNDIKYWVNLPLGAIQKRVTVSILFIQQWIEESFSIRIQVGLLSLNLEPKWFVVKPSFVSKFCWVMMDLKTFMMVKALLIWSGNLHSFKIYSKKDLKWPSLILEPKLSVVKTIICAE